MRVDVQAAVETPAVFVPPVPAAKPEQVTASAAARNDAIVHSMLAGLKANLGVLKSLVTATEAQLQALQGLLGGQMPSPGADIDAFLQDLGVVQETETGFPVTEDLVGIARRCMSASEAGAGAGAGAGGATKADAKPEGKPTAPAVSTGPIFIIKDKAPPATGGKDRAPKMTPSLKRVPSPEDGLESFLKVGRQKGDDGDFGLACAHGTSSWDSAWGPGSCGPSGSSNRSQFP